MLPLISGIQQVGVGVANVDKAWEWYRRYFGVNIAIFQEEAVAALMLPYTGGEPRARNATLAINLQGGGGFEIWQYTERTPQPATFDIQLGDLGIFVTKIKCKDVKSYYNKCLNDNLNISALLENPNGQPHFFVKDPWGNYFELIDSNNWFTNKNMPTGSVYGVVIGVKDMEASMNFYKEVLGYDEVVYDKTDCFEDLKYLPAGEEQYRRVLLKHSKPRKGAFSDMLGESQIELVEAKEGRTRKNMFEGRFWGDLGYIHLCFDIRGMKEMRERCEKLGFPFTVDSSDSFDMGEAAGHFSYTEAPEGTLIEFVETHKIPILKKLGWYLNVKDRAPEKSLPKWMLNALWWTRVK